MIIQKNDDWTALKLALQERGYCYFVGWYYWHGKYAQGLFIYKKRQGWAHLIDYLPFFAYQLGGLFWSPLVDHYDGSSMRSWIFEAFTDEAYNIYKEVEPCLKRVFGDNVLSCSPKYSIKFKPVNMLHEWTG